MQHQKKVALIGDVGGTNIRFELILVDIHSNTPQTIKDTSYKVENYDIFQGAIESFLADVKSEDYPSVAVIGIAGPITDNTVFMANVKKWDTLDGNKLGVNLKIPHFRFLNDFEAASYGVLLVPETDIVSINGLQINPNKIRGIMGPGTGLGNSVLYPIQHKNYKEVIVIPSEGGHTDFPTIDQETAQYFHFFKKEGEKLEEEKRFSHISLQRSFCGPSLPYMYRFFANKYPEDKQASEEVPTPEKIIEVAVGPNPPRIYNSVFLLFFKIYSAAVANFVAQHLTPGGMYLTGSITKSCLPRMIGSDLFKSYKERHPEVVKMVQNVPIVVVSKETELGLLGTFFIARKILMEQGSL